MAIAEELDENAERLLQLERRASALEGVLSVILGRLIHHARAVGSPVCINTMILDIDPIFDQPLAYLRDPDEIAEVEARRMLARELLNTLLFQIEPPTPSTSLDDAVRKAFP